MPRSRRVRRVAACPRQAGGCAGPCQMAGFGLPLEAHKKRHSLLLQPVATKVSVNQIHLIKSALFKVDGNFNGWREVSV